MELSKWGLMWVFLAAPWLAWVAFHPLADARLGWTLVAHPHQAMGAVMEVLHNGYDVPPFSYMFDAMRRPNVLRPHTTSFTYLRKPRSTLRKTLPDAELPEAKRPAPNRRATQRLPLTLCSFGWDER